jgi:hypothetical protein
MATIGVNAKRSREDPSASVAVSAKQVRNATGELLWDPGASARLERDNGDEAQNIGTPRLFTCIHGRHIHARLGTDRLDKAIASIWENGHKLLRKHFNKQARHVSISIGHMKLEYNNGKKIGQADFINKIKKLVQKTHTNASDIQIDFRDMTLRFMQNGIRVEIKKEDLPEEVKEILDFLDQWQSLHTAAMEELGIHSWHGRNDFSSNRSLGSDEPFVIKNANWDDYMPKSEEEYFAEDHFDKLMAKLPEDRDIEETRQILQKAAAFRRAFEDKLDEKIREKQADLDQLAAATPRAKKLKQEIETLKKIKKSIEEASSKTAEERERGEGFKFLPVFTALGFWGSTDPADITQERLDKTSGLIRTGMIEIFDHTRNIGEELYRTPRGRWRGSKPEKDDLTSLATHTGGLLYHSDLDHLGYFDQTGAKRMTGATPEEFVVDQIMHLDDADYECDLRSFGLQTQTPEFQADLRGMISAIAHDVRDAFRS